MQTATVKIVESGNEIEDSGFSRAIGTNNAKHFALFDLKTHILNGAYAAKT
jgi:hypothetical protein